VVEMYSGEYTSYSFKISLYDKHVAVGTGIPALFTKNVQRE
jgi:hypothetical protein